MAGSVPEQPTGGGRADGRLFNTSCLISPTGTIQAVYRKIHLFDVSVEGAASSESATMAPGDELVVSPLGSSAGEGLDRPRSSGSPSVTTSGSPSCTAS